jgi:hypothetical protein
MLMTSLEFSSWAAAMIDDMFHHGLDRAERVRECPQ